jgi:peptidoglycan hydrolase-like protein with peptidoglycan-binding domain
VRPRAWLLATLGLAAAGAAGWGAHTLEPRPAGPPSLAAGVTTAAVTRETISDQQQETGTIGYSASYAVINQYAPPPSAAVLATAIYTSLPAPGQTVRRGQALYSVAGRPIPLLYGPTPIARRLTVGVSGADVQELEANLVALGDGAGLAADGDFTGADTAAVERWQAALGVPRTGVVNPGEAIVLPEALLVSQVKTVAGASAQTGAEIIDGTSTTPVVTIALDARDRALAKVGEGVTVQLPGTDQAVKGTIAAVGTVATTSGQGSSQTTTVPVTVTLADGSAAGGLDGASVTVEIASQTHQDVLTVPIAALLPEPGGGYAVETADSSHRRIDVRTGIFSDSRVEVSGKGLTEGLLVESPSL